MSLDLTKHAPAATSILSVDDNPMIGDVIRMLVSLMSGFTHVGHLLSEVGVIEKINADSVRVLVLDYEIPGTDTLKLIRQVKAAAGNCRVLMLSAAVRKEIVESCRKAGASGYAVKDSEPKMLIDAIKTIARGDAYFDELPVTPQSSLPERLYDMILGTMTHSSTPSLTT